MGAAVRFTVAYQLNLDSEGKASTDSRADDISLSILAAWAQADGIYATGPDSLRSIASDMADDMMSFYTGDKPGGTPGLLPKPPYYCE
jgi:mannan endo-1,6-alpha-mannosidase